MKSLALGGRNRWKDYIDLYFIIKDHFSVEEISKKSRQIFGGEFNEKLFRAQLSYFADIDYTEKVEFLKGFEINDETVKKQLTDFALQ